MWVGYYGNVNEVGAVSAKEVRSGVRAESDSAEGVQARVEGEGSAHFSFGPLLHACLSRAHREHTQVRHFFEDIST